MVTAGGYDGEEKKYIPFTLCDTFKYWILWAWSHFNFSKKGKKLILQISFTFSHLFQRSSRKKTWDGFYNCALLPISAKNKKKDNNKLGRAPFHLTFIWYSFTVTPKSHRGRTLHPKVYRVKTILSHTALTSPSTGPVCCGTQPAYWTCERTNPHKQALTLPSTFPDLCGWNLYFCGKRRHG